MITDVENSVLEVVHIIPNLDRTVELHTKLKS